MRADYSTVDGFGVVKRWIDLICLVQVCVATINFLSVTNLQAIQQEEHIIHFFD